MVKYRKDEKKTEVQYSTKGFSRFTKVFLTKLPQTLTYLYGIK